MYKPNYAVSRAIVIGIDLYTHVSPLSYAVSDANAFAAVLIDQLGFESSNVLVLLNENATKTAILREYLRFSGEHVNPDDRIIIFFAGHGHTVPSLKNEVGYLVPHDADLHDLSTFIRWDELTRNADLIRAKHLLFIMDACYGGLAVTRTIGPGSMRFLRDMMQRVSRQVLTAGKANEAVADSGGPLPNHSIFTGHLLEALSGKAKDHRGNLTANGVIAYVYQHVSADAASLQTPHYGYISGDGDLVFSPTEFPEESSSSDGSDERLVSVPMSNQPRREVELNDTTRLKELLSDTKYRIELHDFLSLRTRELLTRTSEDYFSTHGSVSQEVFRERVVKYEEAVGDFLSQQMLLCRWGRAEQIASLQLPIKHLSSRLAPVSGMTMLIGLRWYPICLLMYAGGLGALIDDDYINLYNLLYTPVLQAYNDQRGNGLLLAITRAMSDIHDGFKLIEGYERNYVPRSEYLYRTLQPFADDTLFVGEEYEGLFDRFELFYSLEYAHLDNPDPIALVESGRVWVL